MAGPRMRTLISIRLFLLALAMLLPCSHGLARQPDVAFDLIDSRSGLSDNYVLCVLQDRYGFLWFGTRDGLTRYDGHTFTLYKHDLHDAGSLSDGGVDCLFEDAAGTLWVGTSGGLNRFDRESGRFLHFRRDPGGDLSLEGGRILSICRDKESNLWVVVGWGGRLRLCRLDLRTGLIHRYRHDPSDPYSIGESDITSVAIDPSGTIWAGTATEGICRYDRPHDRFIGSRIQPSYFDRDAAYITILYVDEQGVLWCRRRTNGLVKILPRGEGVLYDRCDSLNAAGLSHQALTTIYRSRSGPIWIGTGFGGIFRLEQRTGELIHFTHNPAVTTSLSSDVVFGVLEDRAGNIWIGTDNGIDKINRRSWCFAYYANDPLDATSLKSNRVRSVLRDREGTLWVGTAGGGLNAQRRGSTTFSHYDLSRGGRRAIDYNIINVLYQDRRGALWVGTNSGLIRFAPGDGSRTYYVNDPRDEHSINFGGVWDIVEDHDGAIWCCTLHSGINRLDRASGRFTRYTSQGGSPNGLRNDQVHCIHEDARGFLWIGSDGGLDRFDRRSGQWLHYGHDPAGSTSLSNDRVWFIHESAGGILWVGTSGGGVERFDPATGIFTHCSERDGLANDMVCGIVEDDRGSLWISTNRGLSKLDPVTRAIRSYTVSDGLPFNEFHFKACCKDHGRILFGGNGGVIEFDPDSVQDNRLMPALAITSFRALGREMMLDTPMGCNRVLHLDHTENFITIEFAALDFTNPAGNHYLYELEGFDSDWRATDGRRSFASYTNIPPGAYTFRMMASNSDGFWNVESRVLRIVIEPAFWQTVWFKSAILLLTALGVGGLVLARFRALRRKTELERKIVESQLRALQAQMNPHFIFNSLNSILHFITTHDSGSAHKYLVKFSKLMRLILESSRSDSISLREEIDALTLYLDLESLRFDGIFRYEIDVDPELDLHSTEIPPMLIQPYVENAVMHGMASVRSGGLITITLRLLEEKILCTVEDNGIGREQAMTLKGKFSESIRSAGMGVTADRLGILNGLSGEMFAVNVIDIFTPDGAPAGTRVELHLSLL